MELYAVVKTLHILSSTILFGFGAGTAWYLWNAHLTNDPATVARVSKMVVRADWIFTGSSGIMQPATGLWLAHLTGYSLTEPWLVTTYVLYAVAFACWVPVVGLQITAQRLAEQATARGVPLGSDYRHTMRLWFALGWPAFLSLVAIYFLMVAKPTLW